MRRERPWNITALTATINKENADLRGDCLLTHAHWRKRLCLEPPENMAWDLPDRQYYLFCMCQPTAQIQPSFLFVS